MRNHSRLWCACLLLMISAAPLAAQTPAASNTATAAAPTAASTPAPTAASTAAPNPATAVAPNPASTAATNSRVAAPAVVQPPDYVIGPDDVLSIGFWRDKELSADVFVRPDGKISLPLLNDIQAAGLTPEQLRLTVTAAAAHVMEDPTVMVIVKQINSRKVYVVGQVSKPGPYPLPGPMSVVQLLSLAGGLLEYADRENILVIRAARQADGTPISQRVNYADLMKGKRLQQNFELKPGDTVMVP